MINLFSLKCIVDKPVVLMTLHQLRKVIIQKLVPINFRVSSESLKLLTLNTDLSELPHIIIPLILKLFHLSKKLNTTLAYKVATLTSIQKDYAFLIIVSKKFPIE